MPATTGKYLLRVDVSNKNHTMSTAVGVSMIMNDFDVDGVVAHSAGVDCKAVVTRIQSCVLAEMAPSTTQTMTLLLTAHSGASAAPTIPITLSYRTPRTRAAHWY